LPVFIRTQTNANRTYLLLVENQRVQGRIQQRVLARLGRLDELRASGELDRLLASLGRFSEKLAVLGAHAEGDAVTVGARIVGPGLIFERLWQQLGIDRVLTELAGERRFGFAPERAVFVSVLHRLFAPGSESRGGKVAVVVCDQWRRSARTASALSGDGLARTTARAGRFGRPALAHPQGRD
jgi:hypothetical protein